MLIPGDLRVPVRCNCGNEFEVSVAGRNLERLYYTCSGCGAVDRFNKDQIASIVAQYDAAKASIAKSLRKLG